MKITCSRIHLEIWLNKLVRKSFDTYNLKYEDNYLFSVALDIPKGFCCYSDIKEWQISIKWDKLKRIYKYVKSINDLEITIDFKEAFLEHGAAHPFANEKVKPMF
jgi:hypothetical protein